MRRYVLPLVLLAFLFPAAVAKDMPDIRKVPQDLKTPAMEEGRAVPGKRVKVVADRYKGTDVYHALYLPRDWEKGKKYPVIVEYAGNQYKTSPGTVEGSNLGYGISGGKGIIWVCLPYISKDHTHNQRQWWGDVKATVQYCKSVVPGICEDFCGDPKAVFLAGFSRGAIACNFIGLHDDEIAGLWRGFICHSHYDGVKKWGYAGSDRAAAAVRLKRLKNRPQFISMERSVFETQEYLKKAYPKGNFTFQPLPYRNHTDTWVLRDIGERKAVREWLTKTLKKKGQQEAESDAVRRQETSPSRVMLDGIVTDLVTGKPVAGATVAIAGKMAITDPNGHYSVVGLSPGTSRMDLTGPAIIPRSLMVRHDRSFSLGVSVKSSSFNNAMFWASASHGGRIMRRQRPPKWVIYTHVLNSDPPKVFPSTHRTYLLRIILKELPAISDFFGKPHIEIFTGRPNDDPRWTGKKRADGYILCAPMSKGGGYASWKARKGPYVRYAKIRNNFRRAPKVWRHEIAHALGMGHAYSDKKWLPLGVKDPNYERTKLHDGVEMYTDWDKLWLHCVYSGDRPAGNTPPDRDPNDYIHGITPLRKMQNTK